MPQKVYPSAHLLEMFMPYLHDEKRRIDVLRRVVDMDFYRCVELPTFFEPDNRRTVRRILEENDLLCTTYIAPFVNEAGCNPCDLDQEKRRKTLDFFKMHADYCAEAGYSTFGIPSGPDPGEALRTDALKAQAETLVETAEYVGRLGMNLSMEPLDRYAHKKGLVGPMDEAVAWFRPLHEVCPNAYLHWDSSHEQLGGLGIYRTLEMAAPYLSQIHLCDCIDDPTHPCFGDIHMDPAEAPDWQTEGFLTPEVGGEIIRRAASFDPVPGVKRFWVSIEILGHKGDNLWHKERIAREFLKRCWELSGVDMAH